MAWVLMQAHLLFLSRYYYSMLRHSSLCHDIASLCRDIAASFLSQALLWLCVVACVVAYVATFYFLDLCCDIV